MRSTPLEPVNVPGVAGRAFLCGEEKARARVMRGWRCLPCSFGRIAPTRRQSPLPMWENVELILDPYMCNEIFWLVKTIADETAGGPYISQ